MTCLAFVGLTAQGASEISTNISWWDPDLMELVNSTDDNSVSIFTRSQTRAGMVFIESILKICNFSTINEGMYSCLVSNIYGEEIRYWNATLHQEPFAHSFIAVPVAQSSRRYGFSVLMACATYGYPPPTITFNQRGQPISPSEKYKVNTSIENFAGRSDITLTVLEICGFNYEDAGMYSCTAYSRLFGGITSSPWNIDVLAGNCVSYIYMMWVL